MAEFYSTGTITVTNGSTAVVGSGTTWLSSNVKAGDVLNVAGQLYLIASVEDVTHLTLALAYGGATASGLAYTAARTSAAWGTNREIAFDTAEMIRLLTTGMLFEWVIALSHPDGTISAATGVVTFPVPADVEVADLLLFVTEPSTSGNVVADVNLGGTSVLSTKITVEQGENSSSTAATPYVFTRTSWDQGEVLTIDFDSAGLNAEGASITIRGQRRS